MEQRKYAQQKVNLRHEGVVKRALEVLMDKNNPRVIYQGSNKTGGYYAADYMSGSHI